MANISITQAISSLNALSDGLEMAYWDSSDIRSKDRIFDLVSCIHGELNELAKLSVNDHDLPYESITPAFAKSCSKVRKLSGEVRELFPRSSTTEALEQALIGAGNLLSSCEI